MLGDSLAVFMHEMKVVFSYYVMIPYTRMQNSLPLKVLLLKEAFFSAFFICYWFYVKLFIEF